jgi:hypothetical protein
MRISAYLLVCCKNTRAPPPSILIARLYCTLITIYSEIEAETALNGPYFAPTQAFHRGTRRGTRQFQRAKTTKTTVVVVAVRKS